MILKNDELVYTREDIIEILSENTLLSSAVVRTVMDELECEIYNILSTANDEYSVKIKLYRGIDFVGKFIPSKEKYSNLKGKVIKTKPKIKPKVNFARYYCEELYSDNEE